jgi:hypothetical protein
MIMKRLFFTRGLSLTACLFLSALPLACETEPDGGRSASDARDSVVIELTGADSTSVFDLLTEKHDVDCVSTSLGVFVRAIDSIENGPGAYWLYTINDTMADVASDRYITSDGDRIRWHFRKSVE